MKPSGSRKTWWIVATVAVLVVLAFVSGLVIANGDNTRDSTSTSAATSTVNSVDVVTATSENVSASTPASSVAICATPSATGCSAGPGGHTFDPSNGKCQGDGIVPLTSSPLPLDEIGLVVPMGQMIGGHVTPIDHGYIFGIHGHQGSKSNEYEVLAPADGFVVALTATARSGADNFIDHAITFSVTCTLSVHYLNMDSFDDHLLQESGDVTPDRPWAGAIAVKAGEVIGHTGPHGIDIYVWNADLTLTGFVNPDQYTAAEDWKTHTADPYEYFAEPIRSQLLAKNPRLAAPRGGKIDYDVDGRLIGSWFKEGTGGYTGGGHGGEGYWKGHMSIVPDAYDPSGTMVSIGDWSGEARQFGVRGAHVDPAEVSMSTGVVKYELSMTDWVIAATGARWDNDLYKGPVRFAPTDSVQGVLLVQMVGDRRLKVEMFPSKTAGQVTDFDGAAVYYER